MRVRRFAATRGRALCAMRPRALGKGRRATPRCSKHRGQGRLECPHPRPRGTGPNARKKPRPRERDWWTANTEICRLPLKCAKMSLPREKPLYGPSGRMYVPGGQLRKGPPHCGPLHSSAKCYSSVRSVFLCDDAVTARPRRADPNRPAWVDGRHSAHRKPRARIAAARRARRAHAAVGRAVRARPIDLVRAHHRWCARRSGRRCCRRTLC